VDTRWPPDPERDDAAGWPPGAARHDPWSPYERAPEGHPPGYGRAAGYPEPGDHGGGRWDRQPAEDHWQPAEDHRQRDDRGVGHGGAGGYGGGDPYAAGRYATGAHPGDPYATQITPAIPGHRPAPAGGMPVDDEPVDGRGEDLPLAPALLWTGGWFAAPMVLYLLWAAARDGTPPAVCADVAGVTCASPRAAAFADLAGVFPGLLGALALAILAAVGLRRIALNWRAGTVGLAAAVIGTGVATLIASGLG
jgi:hypothetical protein